MHMLEAAQRSHTERSFPAHNEFRAYERKVQDNLTEMREGHYENETKRKVWSKLLAGLHDMRVILRNNIKNIQSDKILSLRKDWNMREY